MHELSIALSIVEGVEEELARQGGGHVSAVHLRIGPLSGVVPEALRFSYCLACEGTMLEGSALLIEEVPIRIYCSNCSLEQEPASTQRLECGVCGALSNEVLQGADLDVAAFELST